jgi:hypothetical protein
MPNRILRDYTYSEKIDKISPQAETCFVRLIMKADDFGKFNGHPTLLKSALFPLKVDRITDKQMDGWMLELQKADLILRYEVNGKKYIKINDFGQRLRLMSSKFPDPLSNDSIMTAECQHDDRLKRNEVETETETETETKAVVTAPDVWDELLKTWLSYRKEKKRQLTASSIPLALEELKKMSGEKIDVARQIVKKSMSNGWQGLFPLEKNQPLKPTSKPVMQNGKFGKL